MVYLLDANVLIDANRDYYSIERVPEFWDWLSHQGETDRVKVVQEIYDEVAAGNDELAKWIKSTAVKKSLLLNEAANPSIVQQVIATGYQLAAPTDIQLETMGSDPFLIAYAVDQSDRQIVTTEASKPSKQGANRHIPDVCNAVNVTCCNTFQMLRDLDFRTSWRPS